MILINNSNQIDDYTHSLSRKKKKTYSNTIYCYDIETVSLFQIDGQYRTFDSSKSKEFYRTVEKRALPYISQFSIEDKVYYFRDFFIFADILESIADMNVTKIIYVHNLSYEFMWMLNFIIPRKWTIENEILRNKNHIISFYIKELNIQFRCSYMLTNLSLEKCGKEYNTMHQKAIGDLDYLKQHSPLSNLNEDELHYSENDLLVMYDMLDIFRKHYVSLQNIPLTQTGEMRKYFLDNYVDFYHIKKIRNMIPGYVEFLNLIQAYWGAITHANFKFVDKVIKNVDSWDYSSDYPFQLCCEKYPCTNFFEIDVCEIEMMKERCCLIYEVTLQDIKSILLNHYIPSSKCLNLQNARFDNGRIVKADSLTLIITDIDYEMISKSYTFESHIHHVYAAYKDYLDKNIILGLLDLYADKTLLKNQDALYFSYMKSKEKLNSSYGCACTNVLKQRFYIDEFNPDENGSVWGKKEFDKKFVMEKINKLHHSRIFFSYSTGVWCTAYARKALWNEIVIPCDSDICYYDTDSGKIQNSSKYIHLIDEINQNQFEKIKQVSKYHNIPIDRFICPDKDGNTHMLGALESDGNYTEFKTLGAKSYCYRDKKDNQLHLTVSGVPKKFRNESGKIVETASVFNDNIDNYKSGVVLGYELGKMALTYDYQQEPFQYIDCDGNEYICDNIRYAIIAQYTTYKLGNHVDIDNILENIESGVYNLL